MSWPRSPQRSSQLGENRPPERLHPSALGGSSKDLRAANGRNRAGQFEGPWSGEGTERPRPWSLCLPRHGDIDSLGILLRQDSCWPPKREGPA